MQYTLKDKIFGFFGVNSKVKDTFKDVNGKGINERYQECLGEGYDDELQQFIDNFEDNVINVRTFLPRFLELFEYQVGNPIIVIDSVARRRKMIEMSNNIYLIKGTRLSHDVLYAMIGLTVDDIVNVERESGFDSSYTLDDPARVFDSGAFCCRHYTLELSGSIAITVEIYALIFKIALYLKPIDAELDGITYNGSPITLDRIFDETFDETFE
jgi:hypothetical protein